MKKFFSTGIFACLVTVHIFAQPVAEKLPVIGEMLENITFNDLANYPLKSLRTSDFKGKWLMLDLWGVNCTGCIASFPKYNNLEKIFGGRLKIIMVGLYSDKSSNPNGEKEIKNLFNYLRTKKQLEFTVAFDKTLSKKWQISGVPYIVLVNPEGKIMAKTISLDSTSLSSFMNGESPVVRYAYSANEKRRNDGYNRDLPLLSTGKMANGGIDTIVMFRSLLTQWRPEMSDWDLYSFDDNHINTGNVGEALNMELKELVFVSHIGSPGISLGSDHYNDYYPRLVYRVKDSTKFQGNRNTGDNMYCYSLTVLSAKNDPAYFRTLMRQDLHRYFGFVSTVEKMEAPVWELIITDQQKANKLKSISRQRRFLYDVLAQQNGIRFRNWPMHEFIEDVFYIGGIVDRAVINKTGIEYNIDIDVKAYMKDFNDVKNALNKNGLDLVAGTKLMNAIIVSDRPQP
jgi:thiol-disulfide isomerase/thioredoxin